MIRNVSIVPAVLAANKEIYLEQIKRINSFAKRIQIDVTDGVFASAKTIGITEVWWPKGWEVDLHLMVGKPSQFIAPVIEMQPTRCILHAEAGENLLPLFEELKKADIKTGVALIQSTYPGAVKQYIEAADHVLIFAGQLGTQGSRADLMQMEKIPIIREIKSEVEIGWDGGANLSNVRALAHADLDIINVGSAIMKAENPAAAFQELTAEIDKNGVVL